MGLHLKEMGSAMNDRLKTSTKSFFLLFLKLFSGFVIGLTLSLVGQELIGYESLSFSFVIIFVTGVFLRVTKKWGWGGVLIFDLIAVLCAMLLRMYILVAPGM